MFPSVYLFSVVALKPDFKCGRVSVTCDVLTVSTVLLLVSTVKHVWKQCIYLAVLRQIVVFMNIT